MNKQLDRFELIERIDEGGSTTVYRAVEHMGQGITRPVAVKVMQSLSASDVDQLEHLRREVEVLIELGGTPNIVSIIAMGVDEDMGTWIAMELTGKSLKHSIGNGAAQPDHVRVLLRDTLRALVCVHGARSRILHRDLKPQNILNSQGAWKVADFGLAKRHGSEDTMALATVKYAAPELLDATLGEESARLDLYSLGLVVYEFALGEDLFRQQFPSIYDPSGGSKEPGGDDRPKWMYWHTSQQMVLPALDELIDGYPKDLSDLVATMTAKPVEQRIASADEALRRLGEVFASAPLEEEVEAVEKTRSVSPAIAMAAAIALVVVIVGGLMYYLLAGRPSINLDSDGEFVASSGKIHVTGRVENIPLAGRAEIRLPRGKRRQFQVALEADGSFACDVTLDELATIEALMLVKDRSGARVTSSLLSLTRVEPETVRIEVRTAPIVSGVSVSLLSKEDNQSHELTTDSNGVVSAELPFGGFSLEVFHPRYSPLPTQDLRTGIDAVWSRTVSLKEVDYSILAAEMQGLIDRLMRLMKKKTECPPNPPLSPAEEKDVVRSMDRLSKLADGDEDIALFIDSIKRVKNCDPRTMVTAPDVPLPREARAGGALAGLEGGQNMAIAQNRLIARIERLIDRKVNCPPGPPSEFEGQALLTAIGELNRLALGDVDILLYIDEVGQVKDCDPSSRPAEVPQAGSEAGPDPAIAQNRLIARIEGLLDRKVNCPPGPPSDFEREALVMATGDLRRLAQGDMDLLLYLDGVGRAEDCDPSSRPADVPQVQTREEKRAEKREAEREAEREEQRRELAAIARAAAGTSGQPGGIGGGPQGGAAGMADQMNSFLAGNALGGDSGGGGGGGGGGEAAGGVGAESAASAIAKVLAGLPPNPELVAKLAKMPLAEFADFVRSNVPVGAIEVDVLESVNLVRLRGPLYSTKDLERMIVRIAYGMARIQPELNIDPWGVCRKLSSSLAEKGASGVRVDAYLVKKDPTLFVQFQRDGQFDPTHADDLASTFVVDQGLLWVRGYEAQPVDGPDEQPEGESE